MSSDASKSSSEVSLMHCAKCNVARETDRSLAEIPISNMGYKDPNHRLGQNHLIVVKLA